MSNPKKNLYLIEQNTQGREGVYFARAVVVGENSLDAWEAIESAIDLCNGHSQHEMQFDRSDCTLKLLAVQWNPDCQPIKDDPIICLSFGTDLLE